MTPRPAPIALFVYNRPQHTQRTLEALAANGLAENSTLHVFCDGPKPSASPEELKRIEAVRDVVRSRNWCGDTIVHESESNLGLAASIRRGVDHVLGESETIVVLEDDIVTSEGFLRFMNRALEDYERSERVMHITGYLPQTSFAWTLPSSFLSTYMSCWGWATWKSAWSQAKWNPSELLGELRKTAGAIERFDLDGTADFSDHLERNANGELKTWAVMWAASIFLANGLCLVPGHSLVRNIGTDGSGVHFRTVAPSRYDTTPVASVEVKAGLSGESRIGRMYLRSFYRYGQFSGVAARTRQLALKARASVARRIR